MSRPLQIQTLIHAVVRQTSALIAQLATSGGTRAPLGHIGQQVFEELSLELERQGINKKVRADMFGMALRTYQRRTLRLKESSTERGTSLWQATYRHIVEHPGILRSEVLRRFRYDDEAALRSVLADLRATGLVELSRENVGDRLSATEGNQRRGAKLDADSLDCIVWSVIFRSQRPTRLDIQKQCGLPEEQLQGSLGRLCSRGEVFESKKGKETAYHTETLYIPVDSAEGWEAAILDHFEACVRTICIKHASLTRPVSDGDDSRPSRHANVDPKTVGGATYAFKLWPGHPLEKEVLESLQEFRARQSSLRSRIDEINDAEGAKKPAFTVVSYAGQHVAGHEERQEKDD